MQVSWIDPEEVRALLKQIAGPVSAPGSAAWETHTIPTGTPAPPLHSPAAPEQPAAAPAPVEPPPAPLPPVAAVPPPPSPPPVAVATESEVDVAPIQQATSIASEELQRIRQRLRDLRQRAEQSGVLPAAVPSVDAPRAPEIQYVQPPRPPVSPPPASLTQAPPPEMAPPRPKTTTSRVPIIPASADQSVAVPSAPAAPPPLPTAPPLSPQPEASPAPVMDPPTSKLERPTFQPPDRGLADRLGALASWACVRLETNEVVLVDDFGDVLWGSPGHTALVLSGMMAWHSSQRSSATAAVGDSRRIDKELQGGQHLTIIPARTRYGTVSLAAIRATRLDEEDVNALHRALIMAVEGPG